ncbi:MAG: flagellar basal body rod protein FlgC [Gemmatimonadaceae bacterium]|nr:flagellar basal body rod protein FlgC [Gemmatimonadaceae bacterium]
MRIGFPKLLPAVGDQPLVKPMFRTLGIAASGLSAQRARLEVTAQNLANAEVTRGADGKPYTRQVVTMQSTPLEQRSPGAGFLPLPPVMTQPGEIAPVASTPRFSLSPRHPVEAANGVTVTGVVDDTSMGPLVYDPGHPDADANGYVRYPNVKITDEIVDMMDAKRIYEANATVFQSAKAMLRKALDI